MDTSAEDCDDDGFRCVADQMAIDARLARLAIAQLREALERRACGLK